MAFPLVHFVNKGQERKIVAVKLQILSPDEIRKTSVAEIFDPSLGDKGKPRTNNLGDIRMGVNDSKGRCGTCSNGFEVCNGHHGHIDLEVPVYHPDWLDRVWEILKCVCYHCSKILVDKENPQLKTLLMNTNQKGRIPAIAKYAKSKKHCVHCGQEQPKYKKVKKGEVFGLETSWPGDLKPKESEENLISSIVIPNLNANLNLNQTISSNNSNNNINGGTNSFGQVTLNITQATTNEKQTIVDSTAKKPFTSEHAIVILKLTPEEDYVWLGLSPNESHPSWMILTCLLVPPPHVRPSVSQSEGSRMVGHDDLTLKLKEVISENAKISKIIKEICKKEGVFPSEIDLSTRVPIKNRNALQMAVATYIDNSPRGTTRSLQRSGQPTKSIITRFKGKMGRFRLNLMGKRVNNSGRTVITPDPNMDVDELGIPEKIARTITYPETVCDHNIKALKKMIMIGADKIGGAKNVITNNGKTHNLAYYDQEQRDELVLEIGWVVERMLIDGDIVVLNRQPSLHKASMMAFKAKIIKDGLDEKHYTFLCNPAITTPYNADFDGDEMNLHVPQSEAARAEICSLFYVSKQIISPQNNGPTMGLIQDNLVAGYFFTSKNSFFDREKAMSIIYSGSKRLEDRFIQLPIPCIHRPKQLWSGKQLFSTLISEKVSLFKKVRDLEKEKFREDHFLDLEERSIVIQKGELICGSLCKATIGRSSGSIIHITARDVSDQEACDFMTRAQRMLNYVLDKRGFSINPNDCKISDIQRKKISDIISCAKIHAKKVSEEGKQCGISKGEIERAITSVTNTTLGKAAGYLKESVDPQQNNIAALVYSGAKGNSTTMAQISSLVGQQSVGGARFGNNSSGRSLSCYGKNEPVENLESRALVSSSFYKGLTQSEYFLHAGGGREGLVDTAVKTAETGYMQRRLMKSIEDLSVDVFGSVKNGEKIIEFNFASHGIDLSQLEKISCPSILWENQKIIQECIWKKCEYKSCGKNNLYCLSCVRYHERDISVEKFEYNSWLKMRDEIRELKQCPFQQTVDTNLFVSVSVKSICDNAISNVGKKFNPKSVIFELFASPREILFEVRLLLCKLRVFENILPLSYKEKFIYEYKKEFGKPKKGMQKKQEDPSDQKKEENRWRRNLSLQYYIRSTLTSKFICTEKGWTLDTLKKVCTDILRKYESTLAAYGEMVGPIAAQSIGEPTTQMSIHRDEEILLWLPKEKKYSILTIVEIFNRYYYDHDLDNNKNIISEYNQETDTTVLFVTLPSDQPQLLSVNTQGEISWKPITAITQHPPNGGLIKITTESGKSVRATLSKSLLIIKDEKIIPILGSEIKVGDCVPVTKEFCLPNDSTFLQSEELLNGSLKDLCDKHSFCISENKICKTIGEKITSIEFLNTREEVGEYVYDFSIPETLNFSIANGIHVRDTLNTFHNAGIEKKNVTVGIPRLKELVDVTSKPKSPFSTVYLKEPFCNSKKLANLARVRIERLSFRDLVKDVKIIPTKIFFKKTENFNSNEKKDWSTEWHDWFDECQRKNSDSFSKTIVFSIDSNKMNLQGWNLEKLARYTHKYIICQIQKESLNELFSIGWTDVSKDIQKLWIRLDQTESEPSRWIKELNTNFYLAGIPGIKKANINLVTTSKWNKITGGHEKKEEWILETSGSSLGLLLGSKFVDSTRTFCNEVHQMTACLGIHAGSMLLFQELKNVISSEASYINEAHIALLVSKMCSTGQPVPNNRHGANKGSSGPLGKSTFEKTTDFLTKGALYAEKDEIIGVSECIMMGQLSKIGTGSVEIRTKEKFPWEKAPNILCSVFEERFPWSISSLLFDPKEEWNSFIASQLKFAQNALLLEPKFKPVSMEEAELLQITLEREEKKKERFEIKISTKRKKQQTENALSSYETFQNNEMEKNLQQSQEEDDDDDNEYDRQEEEEEEEEEEEYDPDKPFIFSPNTKSSSLSILPLPPFAPFQRNSNGDLNSNGKRRNENDKDDKDIEENEETEETEENKENKRKKEKIDNDKKYGPFQNIFQKKQRDKEKNTIIQNPGKQEIDYSTKQSNDHNSSNKRKIQDSKDYEKNSNQKTSINNNNNSNSNTNNNNNNSNNRIITIDDYSTNNDESSFDAPIVTPIPRAKSMYRPMSPERN